MITVNRRPLEFSRELTVEELLKVCNYSYPLIVVRINGKPIPQDEFAHRVVHDGDCVEAIHLVAGG